MQPYRKSANRPEIPQDFRLAQIFSRRAEKSSGIFLRTIGFYPK
jgi:hypothetical protein